MPCKAHILRPLGEFFSTPLSAECRFVKTQPCPSGRWGKGGADHEELGCSRMTKNLALNELQSLEGIQAIERFKAAALQITVLTKSQTGQDVKRHTRPYEIQCLRLCHLFIFNTIQQEHYDKI